MFWFLLIANYIVEAKEMLFKINYKTSKKLWHALKLKYQHP